MSDTIEVQIRANVAGLTSGLKDAAGAVATSSHQMSADLKALGSASAEAHSPMSRFTEGIKDYRSEIRQEARLSRFLAADIAGMGLASKGAAGEITQLVAAFAIGNWIGVAIEGVKTLITHFTELYHEGERTRELTKLYGADLKTMGEEGAKHVHDLKEKVTDLLLSMHELRSETLLRHELEEPLKREKELKEQIAKIQEQIAEASTQSAVTELGVLTQDVTLQENRKTKLEAELAKKQAEISGIKAAVAPLKKSDVQEQAEKEENAAIEHNVRMLHLKAQQEEGVAKLEAEFRAKVAAIRARDDSTEAQDEQEIAALRKVLAKETADYILKYREKTEKEIAQHNDRIIRAEYRAAEAVTKFLDEQQKIRSDNAKKHADEVAQLSDSMAESVSHSISQMVFEAKSFDDAIKDIAKQLAEMAIADTVKRIFGAMMGVTPGTGGLFNGLGLLGSVLGFEHGGDVPSAAAGWDVPSASGAIPAILHPKEMVLPADIAEPLRSNLRGGGSGSAPLQIIIHAMDAQGVRQFVGSRQFADAMREAQRMGRIG